MTEISKRDPYLIVPKLLFFLVNCAFYSIHSVIGIHLYKTLNMTPSSYGIVTSITFVNFFGSIFWSNLADRTGRYKPILIAGIMTFAVVFSLQGLDFKTVIPKLGMEYTDTKLLLFVLAINAVANFMFSGVFPILDNVALSLLSQDPSFNKEMYGRQRLFGSIGHTFATGVSVVVRDNIGKEYIFAVLLVFAVLASLVVWFGVPSGLHVPEHLKGHGHHGGGEKKPAATDKNQLTVERSDTPHSTSSAISAADGTINKNALLIEKAMPFSATPAPPLIEIPTARKAGQDRNPIVVLLTKPAFLLFLLFIFFAGYVRTAMGTFVPLLVAEYKHEKDGYGVLFYQQCAKLSSELLIFYFGKNLMALFGVHWMLLISQFTGIARVLGYGLMPSDPSLLMLTLIWEFLKGLNTGLFFSAAVRISNDIAPKGCGNTAQGIFGGVYNGIAAALANLISGFVIDALPPVKHGIPIMFLMTAAAAGAVTVIFMIKFALFDRVIFVGKGSAVKSHA